MKKILSMILALSVALSALTVSAASYTDMPADSEAIEVLSSLGVISGYEDGNQREDCLSEHQRDFL